MMTTTTTVNFRFFLLALILIVAPLIQVGKCQSDVDPAESVDEGGDIGIVGEDVQDFGEEAFSAAAGVETTYVFPHNSVRLVKAGEKTELLVGIKNNGESALNVLAIKSSIHLPYDHRYQIQNLTVQTFNQSTVPPSATATYPYLFAVSPFLQSGNFDLVATVIYEIDQSPYQTTFYNGTIEVVEAGGVVSIESIFLITLGVALLVFLGIWVRGQVQNLSKKSKKAPSSKVEVGTAARDASLDEWLQGTAYTQSLASKSKKQK
uniref:Translocon-associated protein subunit alpha n=1 Tax=Kalanchoe fedtschenkoi TaxID=63787 RepID=A0A7N0U5V7_KALFE